MRVWPGLQPYLWWFDWSGRGGYGFPSLGAAALGARTRPGICGHIVLHAVPAVHGRQRLPHHCGRWRHRHGARRVLHRRARAVRVVHRHRGGGATQLTLTTVLLLYGAIPMLRDGRGGCTCTVLLQQSAAGRVLGVGRPLHPWALSSLTRAHNRAERLPQRPPREIRCSQLLPHCLPHIRPQPRRKALRDESFVCIGGHGHHLAHGAGQRVGGAHGARPHA